MAADLDVAVLFRISSGSGATPSRHAHTRTHKQAFFLDQSEPASAPPASLAAASSPMVLTDGLSWPEGLKFLFPAGAYTAMMSARQVTAGDAGGGRGQNGRRGGCSELGGTAPPPLLPAAQSPLRLHFAHVVGRWQNAGSNWPRQELFEVAPAAGVGGSRCCDPAGEPVSPVPTLFSSPCGQSP